MLTVTHAPRASQIAGGVSNLRGKVILVVDLRLEFNKDARSRTDKPCIIVVRPNEIAGAVTTDFVVEEACKVLEISANAIEGAPSIGRELDRDHILGTAKTKGRSDSWRISPKSPALRRLLNSKRRPDRVRNRPE